MYNISISTCFDYSIPIVIQLPMVQKAGYNYISIGGNYEHSGILDKSRLTDLMKQLRDNNLSVDTIHGYEMDKSDTIAVNKNVVNAAVQLGAPVIVIHCSSFTFEPTELNSRRADILRNLPLFEQMAQDSGLKFAFENVLPGVATDLMEEIIRRADPAYFGLCYDSSHDQIGGPRSFELLEKLSERLCAVHISDRTKEFVDHNIPGEGFIDFGRLCVLLKQAAIKFPLLLEVMTTYSTYKDPEEFLAVSYREAVNLYNKIYL